MRGFIAFLILGVAGASSVELRSEEKVTPLTAKWTTLFSGKNAKPANKLPTSGRIQNVADLQLIGPGNGHPLLLGQWSSDGDWRIADGGIQLSKGHAAALQLARVTNFELNGELELEDLGGWFFLIGWHEGKGSALYSYTTKLSGTGWWICDFEDGKAVPDSNHQLKDFEWKHQQDFTLTAHQGELTLKVGKRFVCEKEKILAQAGDLMLGVYDTQYGPRKMKLANLRIREPETKKPAADQKEAPKKELPDKKSPE